LEKAAVVIVTHNRLSLLRECLEAVRAQSAAAGAIVVVDNASDDGTGQYLRHLGWPDLVVLSLRENLGGAGGFSLGLQHAIMSGYDLAWLMDDDCIPHPDALMQLVQARRQMQERGVAHSFLCSRALDTVGSPCNQPVPSRAENTSGWPRWADVADLGYVLVDECTFVSVLVCCETAKQAGLPFAAMFIWGDDVEYTRRLSRISPGIFVGKSIVVHKRAHAGGLDVFREQSAKRLALYHHHYRNRIYLYREYFDRWRYYIFLFQVLGDVLRLTVHLRFRAAAIVCRGFWSGIWFRPPIEMVEHNEKTMRRLNRIDPPAQTD
jgi:GT2 family glycosyltransferase